jgi:glycosyltransferase involved in cell wall biosynthesis
MNTNQFHSSQIFVSIIVPVYNVEKYLPDCLDSLLFQQGDDLEVVAVNDGSTDRSLAILKEYQEKSKRLKVLDTGVNKGVSAARNAGLRLAQGTFLLFVDADDKLVAGAVELLKGYVQRCDPDIIMFKHIKISSNDDEEAKKFQCEEMRLYDLNLKKDRIRAFNGFVGSLLASNGCYRRQLTDDLLFGDYTNGEDVLFGVQAFCAARRVLQLDIPLYQYLQRSDSASKVRNGRHCLSSINICEDIFRVSCSLPYYLDIQWILFKKLRGMSHGLILNVLKYVPVSDQQVCWKRWFEVFNRIYCDEKLAPRYKCLFYKLVFTSGWPLCAIVFFRLPADCKRFIYGHRWGRRIWTCVRKYRLCMI